MSISLPPRGSEAKKIGSDFAPLQTSAQATPNMTVKVAEGAFWTAENEFMEYIGGTSPNIAPATSSGAKWVLVTVTTTGMLNVINGAVSGTPILPDPSLYSNELPLAALFVGDTTTAITNDMIYDLRPLWQIPPDSVSQTQLTDFATITYVDNSVALKADEDGTPSANFTLNRNGSAITDSGIYVDGTPAGIRFNASAMIGSPPVATSAWEFTNDGVTWNPIGVASGSYYTKSDLDGGALNTLYFTQNDLNVTGVLDGRYYETTLADATFSVIGHTHVVGDIAGLADPVETINNMTPVNGDMQLGLNELNDVTNALPSESHTIVYRAGAYINGLLSTNDLSDIDTAASTPVAGDVLVHNGGAGFVNRPLVKSDISDFLGSAFLLTTNLAGDPPAGDGPPDSNGVAQDVYGVKTFKDGINIETSLTVSGVHTHIQTTDLQVTDPYIDLNWSETGDGVSGGTGVAGIRIDRGISVGSPTGSNPAAIIQWDENAGQWEFGIEGSANPILGGAHTHNSSQITDFSFRVTTELNSNTLTEMQDVSYITTPSTGDYLRFGITAWENKVFATDITAELNVNDLEQIQDVSYTTAVAGEVLQWDGTLWANHLLVKSDVSDFSETEYIHADATTETKAGDLNIGGDFAVAGNFTVGSGTNSVTVINSDDVRIFDPVITINNGETGNGVGGGTGVSGIEVDRGTEQNVMLYWSDPAKTWVGHHTISAGSPASPTLTTSPLSFEGHHHVITDMDDINATAGDINTLVGITTSPFATVQDQLDDKISRQGDAMDNSVNLTFAVGGEVLGLPAIPSATAATSKEYVDATFVDIAGDTMGNGANLTFVAGGEVLGLPAIPTVNTAATSKLYVDTHIGDATLHFTEASIVHQNISGAGTNTHATIDTHIAAVTNNPHSVTKLNVGLGNVDDTSDINKPISTLTQTALDLKADQTALDTHTTNVANPHATAVSNLGDVTLTAIADTEMLAYSSGNWVNVPAPISAVTDHILLTNIGTNTHAQIDTHIADATIHFTEASINHANILNVGSNTHAAIDLHMTGDVSQRHTAGVITNIVNANITATNVQSAINQLDTIKAGFVSPAFTGTPTTITGTTGDSSTQIANNTFVAQEIAAIVAVDSFNTRTGAVVSVAGDYTASDITNVAFGDIGAVTVQAAIDELDTEKAPTVHQHIVADVIDFSAGVTLELGLNSISTLADVTLTAPVNSHVLQHDGTDWKNVVISTNTVAEGTNLYYTEARVDANTTVVGKVDKIGTTVVGNVVTFSDTAGAQADSGILSTDLAPLASPIFTGIPAADTAATTTNTTQLATTAFVQQEITANPSPVTTVFTRTGNVVAATGDYTAAEITNVAAGDIGAVTVQDAINELDTEKAPLASPVFTGIPVLPPYTLVTLPTVVEGGMIFVTDANTGAGAMCYGQILGSPDVWIDVTTGIAVA